MNQQRLPLDELNSLLRRYRVLASFHLRYSHKPNARPSLEVPLLESAERQDAVRIKFINIAKFEIRQDDSGGDGVELLVSDIRDRELKGLNFEVSDEQSNTFFLLAEDFGYQQIRLEQTLDSYIA